MMIQAPTGGWNAISSLAEMPPQDAYRLDNLIPDSESVRSRRGYAAHTTTTRSSARTLVSYNASTPKLLLGGGGNIYDITAGGAGTDLTSGLGAFTNNEWHTNGYKDKIIFCNSADTPLEYAGSSGTVSQLSLTGPTATELAGSVTFKGRVIYWEKPAGSNPRSFWYAAAGAYTGTLTEFALDEFAKTGYIVACAEWTRDGGEGMDDYFVVFMSTGETLIYAGSDPGDATDWYLVGIFRIGEPIGIKPVTQVGSDLIVLTKDGYVVLSAALGGGRYTEESLFSYKINTAAARAARNYGGNFGWEATLFAEESLFVVNVPISSTASYQHVRNTTTGAWCRFTGFDATAFAVHSGKLYFAATDGIVYKYQGTSDDGGFIPMRADQAYNSLGAPHIKKQITAVKVFSNYAFPKYLHSSIHADFNEKTLESINDPPEPTPSDWDVGEWDVAEWDAAVAGTRISMKPIQAFGFFLSHTLRLRSRAQQFIWYATQLVAKKGGVI